MYACACSCLQLEQAGNGHTDADALADDEVGTVAATVVSALLSDESASWARACKRWLLETAIGAPRRVEFCYVAAMKSYLALWRTVTWHWSVHAAEKEMAAEQPERFEQERGALLGLLAVACLKGDVNTTAAKLRITEQLNNGDAAALELACDERLVHVLMVASSEITQLYAGIFVKYVKMGVLAFGALGALLLALIIVWW
eukprot:COSAG01_NODE_6275_length_3759_cov_249.376606_4_plen_201_part_00